MKKTSVFVRLTCMVAIGLTMVACGRKNQSAQQQQGQVPELAVMTVEASDATLETAYPATLHGQNDVEIRPQISGFLTAVNVHEGQKVSKGQVLFTIDQVTLKAAVEAARSQVNQAEAAVKVAEANVNTAQTNANNNKLLLDQNIISASAYQTSVDALNAAKAQLNQAKAAVSASRAALTQAEKTLSYSVVTAPNAGLIGSIPFKEGALVSPSSLLTMLSNSADMEAYFSFTETELLAFTGDGSSTVNDLIAKLPPVKLQLADGSMYPQEGKIISVSGVLDSSTGSATAKALFPNPNGTLRSGSTGKVLIPTHLDNVITIPQTATFEIQGLKYCFLVNKENRLVQTPITVSDDNDGKNYVVTAGLNPGDRVLLEGVGISAKDGMEIKPKGM